MFSRTWVNLLCLGYSPTDPNPPWGAALGRTLPDYHVLPLQDQTEKISYFTNSASIYRPWCQPYYCCQGISVKSQPTTSPQGWAFYFVLIPKPLPWAAICTSLFPSSEMPVLYVKLRIWFFSNYLSSDNHEKLTLSFQDAQMFWNIHNLQIIKWKQWRGTR